MLTTAGAAIARVAATRRRGSAAAAFRHRSFPLNGQCRYARQMPPITSLANSSRRAGPHLSMRSPRNSACLAEGSASCAIGTTFRFPLGDGGRKSRPGTEFGRHRLPPASRAWRRASGSRARSPRNRASRGTAAETHPLDSRIKGREPDRGRRGSAAQRFARLQDPTLLNKGNPTPAA